MPVDLAIHDWPLAYESRLDERPRSAIDLIVIHCTELPDMAMAREYGERILYPEAGTGAAGHWYVDRDGSITEHVPAARWNESGLMNTRGELFLENTRHIPPELPQLNGPPGTEAQVAKLYLETYPRLLEVGLRLSRVDLDPRGAWSLTLSNGVEIRLGRQDVKARLERFLQVASPLVAARSGEVQYVDLRYSNGFSVGWNAPARVAQGAPSTPDA